MDGPNTKTNSSNKENGVEKSQWIVHGNYLPRTTGVCLLRYFLDLKYSSHLRQFLGTILMWNWSEDMHPLNLLHLWHCWGVNFLTTIIKLALIINFSTFYEQYKDFLEIHFKKEQSTRSSNVANLNHCALVLCGSQIQPG